MVTRAMADDKALSVVAEKIIEATGISFSRVILQSRAFLTYFRAFASVIPAPAGIQSSTEKRDTRFHGYDNIQPVIESPVFIGHGQRETRQQLLLRA